MVRDQTFRLGVLLDETRRPNFFHNDIFRPVRQDFTHEPTSATANLELIPFCGIMTAGAAEIKELDIQSIWVCQRFFAR